MNNIKKIIRQLVLIFITLLMFFPLYTVFVMGTYYSEDIFIGLPILPGNYLLENLETVLKNNFFQAYLNSFTISIFSVLFSVTASSMVGYALAKFNFKARKFFFSFILVIMMIPGQISMIGYIREMRAFGLMGTLLPLIFVWIAHPFGAFFMTQFIRDSVPDEILESARIDGSSESGIFFRIVLRIITPAITTLTMLVFLWSWNSYMMPLIIINKQELYTIPLMVATLSNQFRSDYGAMMCALSLAVLPMILIFTLSSKTFIKGIAAGAVKG